VSNRIELSGFPELENLLHDMTISDAKEKKAMRLAIIPIKEGLEQSTPTGKTGKLGVIKTSVKKEGFATVGILKLGAFWGTFQEYGTSQQRHHVGFFDATIRRTEGAALAILTRELLGVIT